MTQSGEKGDSVYLRGWDDYERYSLEAHRVEDVGPGPCRLPHALAREALERRAAALKGSGFDVGWTDGDLGHGKTFVCKDPGRSRPSNSITRPNGTRPRPTKPALKNQAQRFPARGVNVRRLDHCNGLALDIKANREFLRGLSRLPPDRADRAR